MLFLFIMFFLVIGILCFMLYTQNQEIEKVSKNNVAMTEELNHFKALVQKLQKWQRCVNVETEIQQMVQKGRQI